MSARLVTNEQRRDVPVLGPNFDSLTPSGAGYDGRQIQNAPVIQLDKHRQHAATLSRSSPIERELAAANQALRTILAAHRDRLDPDMIDRIYARLSVLLDANEREEGDELPNLESFRRMILFLSENRSLRRPSIFVNRFGLFNASWRPEKRKLASLVFQPRNDVTWLIFLPREDDSEDTKEVAGRSPRIS